MCPANCPHQVYPGHRVNVNNIGVRREIPGLARFKRLPALISYPWICTCRVRLVYGSRLNWLLAGNRTPKLSDCLGVLNPVSSEVDVRGGLVVGVLGCQSWALGFNSLGIEIWLEILLRLRPVTNSALMSIEYTDRTLSDLSVGRWDGEGEDWPPALRPEAKKMKVANT